MRKAMNTLHESLRMSFSNVRNNKMRSFLTILGIVIGVAAVISLITVVQSVTDEMTHKFAEMGTGKLNIIANGTPLKRGLSEQDLDALLSIDNISGISPSVSFTASGQRGTVWQDDITIEGRNEVYFQANTEIVAQGRAINALDVEQHNYVCLIDSATQEKFFYMEDPIGKMINLGGTPHMIIGILSSSGNKDLVTQAMGSSHSGKAVIPYTTAMKLRGIQSITQLELYAEDTAEMRATIDQVEMKLSSAFNYKEGSCKSTATTLPCFPTMPDMGIVKKPMPHPISMAVIPSDTYGATIRWGL